MLENCEGSMSLTRRTRQEIGNTNGSRYALQDQQEQSELWNGDKYSKNKSKLASILEAHESTRPRMGESLANHDEDHIARKGDNSLQHHNLVHKFIHMLQAMKIPAAKAAVDKEWENVENISAWNLTKVRSEKDVIDETRTKGVKVHFASLMDICHLKNAELEAKHQKFKGRIVLRGDIV